jgi:predicted nucleic acid-binding protein
MSKHPILIDSNILVYAINITSPKHLQAQAFLQDSQVNMVLAHQNIFETLRVLINAKFPHPMKPTDAISAISNIMEACQVIAPEQDTHHIALSLIKAHKLTSNKIFDAYLAATALSVGITTIATDNVKDFQVFKGLKVYNPFS